jgi:formamidopyrimidine-DNA glycosylase
VEGLERHGKYLIAGLDGGSRLVVHLGMTGQLFVSGASSVRLLSATARSALAPEQQPDFEPDSHTHLQLRFEDGGPEVFLRDVRKFGKVLLLASGESHPRLERLGVDALEVEGEMLFSSTRGRSVAVKNLLLDQSVLTGVGNIYADEALHRAGVRPTRRASRVTRRECEALALEIRRVLQRSIETGGSSIRDYVAPDGSDGGYQDERRVYGRTGEPCPACEKPIRRIVVGARGTHYCPECQK